MTSALPRRAAAEVNDDVTAWVGTCRAAVRLNAMIFGDWLPRLR